MRRLSHHWLLTGGFLAALVATAVLAPRPSPSAATGELQPFASCVELRDWYVRAALPKVGPWGLDGGWGYIDDVGGTAVTVERSDAAASSETAGAAEVSDTGAAVDNGETGTNVQEAGVDEPDIAKTDGEVVYIVDGDDLLIERPTADGAEPVAGLNMGLQRGAEILLVDDAVVVLETVRSGELLQPDIDPGMRSDTVPSTDRPYGPTESGQAQVEATTVDVSDPTSPEIVSTQSIEGTLVSARAHEGTVRIVSTAAPTFDFVHPGEPGRGLTEAEAERVNRDLVRRTSVADWLPATGVDGDATELDCGDVVHPRSASGFATLVVTTFGPQSPAEIGHLAVVSDGSLVYSSADRLYVSTVEYHDSVWSFRSGETRAETTIHAFDASGTTTAYVASGGVAGQVPDRWAFSEDGGVLRVATVGVGDNDRGMTESSVHVLRERGSDLDEVGVAGGMGVGEDLKAVRWFGDLAVLVTFRQTDPLYTVDLSDAGDPRVIGELKIPGFSRYLHPIGDDRLLGIGQDADSRTGMEKGAQASIFDLGDLADPQRLSTAALSPNGGGRSATEDDSRAFTYDSSSGTAYVPVSPSYSDTGTRITVLQTGVDGGLMVKDRRAVPGSASAVRVLPLADGTVALVADGHVDGTMA